MYVHIYTHTQMYALKHTPTDLIFKYSKRTICKYINTPTYITVATATPRTKLQCVSARVLVDYDGEQVTASDHCAVLADFVSQ